MLNECFIILFSVNWIWILKILSILMIVCGSVIILFANRLVKKFDLTKKHTLNDTFKKALPEKDLEEELFKITVISLKIKGLVIALPGFILVFWLFK